MIHLKLYRAELANSQYHIVRLADGYKKRSFSPCLLSFIHWYEVRVAVKRPFNFSFIFLLHSFRDCFTALGETRAYFACWEIYKRMLAKSRLRQSLRLFNHHKESGGKYTIVLTVDVSGISKFWTFGRDILQLYSGRANLKCIKGLTNRFLSRIQSAESCSTGRLIQLNYILAFWRVSYSEDCFVIAFEQ